MHDLVIRNGLIVDGTGADRFHGDLAVDGGRITEVVAAGEGDLGAGRQELDADGCVVAPGWVDIHTHYDGQVTWDPEMAPSSWHGATTVVMGNCGVGFAPARPDERDFLIELMEAVEDEISVRLLEADRRTRDAPLLEEVGDELERLLVLLPDANFGRNLEAFLDRRFFEMRRDDDRLPAGGNDNTCQTLRPPPLNTREIVEAGAGLDDDGSNGVPLHQLASHGEPDQPLLAADGRRELDCRRRLRTR